ncbi:MAG: hypothetical protein HOF44_03205 [Pelagibacterales bacterium]|jgi:hypothetical protein|nr:hypothetical protein [Pelagibacterales bacterium]MBT5216443.1 hypothetical protein [Gammaproteobacteria bacterium]
MPLQPNEINQLNVVSFETNFTRLPNVNFFCQRINIPSIGLGLASQATPFSDIPVLGDKLLFEQLTLNFIVSEDLSNYLEIYNWLISIGFPENDTQFNLNNSNVEPTENLRSDMNIIINTNKSNPNYSITFRDAFPVSLGSIELDAAATSLEPIILDVSFAYTGSFSIEKIT